MATKIKTWQIVEGNLEEIESSLSDEGRTEAYDLESWIASNPSIVEQDLTINGSYGLPFFIFLLVKMMRLGIVLMGSVTLQTEIVALFYWFDTVDVVAVAAAHITMIHFTLGEGAINIYFLEDLSIRKI